MKLGAQDDGMLTVIWFDAILARTTTVARILNSRTALGLLLIVSVWRVQTSRFPKKGPTTYEVLVGIIPWVHGRSGKALFTFTDTM